MAEKTEIEKLFELSSTIPLIDVRSPAEYTEGHIPGAINVPLLDNEERKIIGTLYKKHGQKQAIQTGFEIIAAKSNKLSEAGLFHAKNSKLILYCWRGGMRSSSLAWFFERKGIQCKVLDGGYKSYRIFSKNYLSKKWQIKILGGMTGSGKTDILKELRQTGQQMVDLEGIAHHKGSAFGSLGEEIQSSNEQFENHLFQAFYELDINKAVWLEDESRNIGRVFIPEELFSQMRKSEIFVIQLNEENRILRLVEDYGKYSDLDLIQSIERIRKRIGGQNANTAIEAIKNKDYASAARLSLHYYDKTYLYGLEKRQDLKSYIIDCPNPDAKENAFRLLKVFNQSK